MTPNTDAVLAGSKAFVSGLLSPLSTRLRIRARVAGDRKQAFELCHGGAGLLVFEYLDREWLALCKDLRAIAGGGLAIVAAVPPDRKAAREELASAGVEHAAPWNGNPEPLLEAIGRALASRAKAAAPLPGGAPKGREAGFDIDDQIDDHILGDALEPADGPDPFGLAAAPTAVRSGAAPSLSLQAVSWPAGLIAAADAEFLLISALAGSPPALPWMRETTDRALSKLTELERRALQGDLDGMEPGPLRRAAALRWQLGAALATAPAKGSPVDSAAVAALLAGVDEVLAQLSQFGEGAAPEARAAVDEARKALVKEAIDITDLVHRLAPSAPQAAPARAVPRAAAAARVLSVEAPTKKGGRARTPRGPWIVLALSVAVAGGYHGSHVWSRSQVSPPPTLPGAPEGMVLVPSAGMTKVLVMESRGTVDPQAVERFRTSEEAKGNAVREIGPGRLMVMPREAAERMDKAAKAKESHR